VAPDTDAPAVTPLRIAAEAAGYPCIVSRGSARYLVDAHGVLRQECCPEIAVVPETDAEWEALISPGWTAEPVDVSCCEERKGDEADG
jgi:hypothetical protein